MSAEALVYDRLESETIPVVGLEGQNAVEEEQNPIQKDLDDPNVQVPEGMSRFYIDFTVQKPEEKLDEEESLGMDGAIAEDAKVASPNSRKVAATWEDCKAKDKATCPYHGAAFMRDQFNAIFQKHGFSNASVRVAPYGSDKDPMPAYRMYFNLPKNYDKKALQKAFNEMMKVGGVGKLNAGDIVDKKYHTEPEDKELSYDIEEFDPNIDPNDEMAKDLEQEKIEAEKKAAEEKAKQEALEKAKKEAEEKKKAEEAKKKAEEMEAASAGFKAQLDKLGVAKEYPDDPVEELKYLDVLLAKTNSFWSEPIYVADAKEKGEAYQRQLDSLNAIKGKIASTNNPETKAVLERIASKSEALAKQKETEFVKSCGDLFDHVDANIMEGIASTDHTLENHANMFGKAKLTMFEGNGKDGEKKSLAAETHDLYEALTPENKKAFQENNAELLQRIKDEKAQYDVSHEMLRRFRDGVIREMSENDRLDKALAIIDSTEYDDCEKKYKEASGKLFQDMLNNLYALKKAHEAQDAEPKVKGQTASASDVNALMKTIGTKHFTEEQRQMFISGMSKMPATFVKSMSWGVSYATNNKMDVCYATDNGNGLATITTTQDAIPYLGLTMAHEMGHAFFYRHGLARKKPLIVDKVTGKLKYDIPQKISTLISQFEEEGRKLIYDVFGYESISEKGRTKHTLDLIQYIKDKVEGYEDVEYYWSNGMDKTQWQRHKEVRILSDMLGCVNVGGFEGHKNKLYKIPYVRAHELLSQGIVGLTGNAPLIEKFFPKSLAKLREFVESDKEQLV